MKRTGDDSEPLGYTASYDCVFVLLKRVKCSIWYNLFTGNLCLKRRRTGTLQRWPGSYTVGVFNFINTVFLCLKLGVKFWILIYHSFLNFGIYTSFSIIFGILEGLFRVFWYSTTPPPPFPPHPAGRKTAYGNRVLLEQSHLAIEIGTHPSS